MSYQLEVCIDNIESLHNAIAGGATRIELCSSLALGGLTPSFGLMKQAATMSPLPVYAMIRPRQGDFFYHNDDIAIMVQDIHCAHQAGLQGVVFGLLNQDGTVDTVRSRPLVSLAHSLGMGVTFHRAFDQCRDPLTALEAIIALGCERLLTSGQARTAPLGATCIARLVQLSGGRISIMAGAGVNAENLSALLRMTGVSEVHLSGKTTRRSDMDFVAQESRMGHGDSDEFQIPVTDTRAIHQAASVLKSIL